MIEKISSVAKAPGMIERKEDVMIEKISSVDPRPNKM